MDPAFSMWNPRVAGGASFVFPAHRRPAPSGQTLITAAASSMSKYRSQARHGELFSRGRDRRLPLHPICVRRTRTMVSSCLANFSSGIVASSASLQNMERLGRIRKQLLEPELSPSSYDTAWVAMVPLPGSPKVPCFPQCVEWILQNQHRNGSWCPSQMDAFINKDILSSTLACVLALKRWNVGPKHIIRGLNFLGRNFSVVTDEHIPAPIGFNVSFARMISLAIGMGLELPVEQNDVDGILHLREMELKRLVGNKSYGKEKYMAYVAEGLGNLVDWNDVMKFQRKNGSLFNSPSATAALLIQNYDDKALQYLNSLVSKFGGSVPTVYPNRLHCQLSMVDSLEKIGISQRFSSEIKSILDVIYCCWLQKDEEIMLDVATCAMAFRLLRMNGYDVSSDQLSHVGKASYFHNSLQGYLNDTISVLELYKASKVSVSEHEKILDNIGCWSGNLLKETLSSHRVDSRPIFAEVEYALKFPFYATMERLEHKRNIEYFDAMGSQMLKTEILPCCVNQDFLALAVEDFTFSQLIYQDELLSLKRWAKENRLDQLQFARSKLAVCYLSSAATIFPPELSNVRISWTKNSVLATYVDDFFDYAGSKEELGNLVARVERWDEHSKEFCSEEVKILFYAIYTTVNQLSEMVSTSQKRDITKHMIELWLQLLRAMMTEAEWRMTRYVPTIEEYLETAAVSFAVGPVVLIALYFVGPKLSGSIVKDQEYNDLFWQTGMCGRLLNDIQGFERESGEGNLDSVSLLMRHNDGSMSIEAAKDELRISIASSRKELLKLVLKEDCVVPRPCRELLWKMSKTCHFFYSHTDGFSSQTEMLSSINAVIKEPLKLHSSNLSLPVEAE